MGELRKDNIEKALSIILNRHLDCKMTVDEYRQSDLGKMGIDSLMLVEIIIELEEEFHQGARIDRSLNGSSLFEAIIGLFEKE